MLNKLVKEFKNIEILNEVEGFQSVEVFGGSFMGDGIIIEEVQGALGTDYLVSTMQDSFYFNNLNEAINKVRELLNDNNGDDAKKNVLNKINSSFYEIERATEKLYRGKLFVVANSVKIETYYKTRKGALRYIEKNKDFSYYCDYKMDLVYPNSTLEVVEIKENEIKNINDVNLWFKELLFYLGRPYQLSNIDYYVKQITDTEVLAYVKKGIEAIKSKNGLMKPNLQLRSRFAKKGEVRKTEEKKETTTDKEILFANDDLKVVEVGATTRIYFNGKPSDEVRNSIKKLGFRFYKNDGFYWGVYSNKTTLEVIKETLNIIEVEAIENTDILNTREEAISHAKEQLKQLNNNIEVDTTETIENDIVRTEELEIIEVKENTLYFGIEGEGTREDKEYLTYEQLEKEFNLRVRDEGEYQEEFGKGGYCKTWIHVYYNDTKYRTCRIDLVGKEQLKYCLSEAIEDVLKGFNNDIESTCKYYFNTNNSNDCLILINELIQHLKVSEVETEIKEELEKKKNIFLTDNKIIINDKPYGKIIAYYDYLCLLKNNNCDKVYNILQAYQNTEIDINNMINYINDLNLPFKIELEKVNRFTVIETQQEQPQKQTNVNIINNMYNEVEALENRLKLVTSAKLKYKIKSKINFKMQEIAKLIIQDPILYQQFLKETKEE